MNNPTNPKILLAVMPFWVPLIPPLGIASLKSFLEPHGYTVKTMDFNTKLDLKSVQDQYYLILKEAIPQNEQSNFYNIGQDVLYNHMMAHLHYEDEEEYLTAIQVLIRETFYTTVEEETITRLIQAVEGFYKLLQSELLEVLQAEKPDVFGLSVYTGTLPASYFAFQLAKQVNPEIRTLMGGGIFSNQLIPGSLNFKRFLEKTPFIDKFFIGEGENLLLKYLSGELNPAERVYTLQEINNQILDIQTAPTPDFSDLDLQMYLNLGTYTSRSCPFQCSFCSETVHWGPYRKKGSVQIVEELLKLQERYEIQLFLMGDSLLNPVITDLATELIKADASVYWDGYLRADLPVCNPENTLLWRRGGFYRARLGVESGSQHVLDLMGKKITPEQIKTALSSIASAGIKTTTYWVVGHPGETEEDFQQTLDLIEEMQDQIYEADCNPFNYYPSGQVNSAEWAENNTSHSLYPEEMDPLLILQTYTMNCEPSREVTYRRMNRLIAHLNKLGIPNPYSLQDIYQADKRWKRLHLNAVPALIDFKKMQIDENKKVKKLVTIESELEQDGDFDF